MRTREVSGRNGSIVHKSSRAYSERVAALILLEEDTEKFGVRVPRRALSVSKGEKELCGEREGNRRHLEGSLDGGPLLGSRGKGGKKSDERGMEDGWGDRRAGAVPRVISQPFRPGLPDLEKNKGGELRLRARGRTGGVIFLARNNSITGGGVQDTRSLRMTRKGKKFAAEEEKEEGEGVSRKERRWLVVRILLYLGEEKGGCSKESVVILSEGVRSSSSIIGGTIEEGICVGKKGKRDFFREERRKKKALAGCEMPGHRARKGSTPTVEKEVYLKRRPEGPETRSGGGNGANWEDGLLFRRRKEEKVHY